MNLHRNSNSVDHVVKTFASLVLVFLPRAVKFLSNYKATFLFQLTDNYNFESHTKKIVNTYVRSSMFLGAESSVGLGGFTLKLKHKVKQSKKVEWQSF